MRQEITHYSAVYSGDTGNYGAKVRFDKTTGYIGITQFKGTETERVLLSPAQVKELLKFIGQK